ncbi:U6 snRNA phosphodiesterase Usb1 [Xylaria intraflava]|nr:U6 snRNA phosphodiesterase Usb1 [Xylaria intraflava]
MALVDYSSDESLSESGDGTHAEAKPKRQKTTHGELPPLPSAFHDLYASTVRVSASDDPALHQGRKRVNPHKVGNWPSHIYIEWHPTPVERKTLTTLLSTLQQNLSSPSASTTPIAITSFLTSDLGTPQPLHISLSRPIVLSTAQKDRFHSSLESSIRESGIPPFELATRGVEWHRTAESARSFLVLRVGSVRKDEKESRQDDKNELTNKSATNPHLATLLHRTNALVTAFGQPALYVGPDNAGDTIAEEAFHISIAWSPAAPTAEVRRLTDAVFNATTGGDAAAVVRAMRVRAEGVKVKIGNVVTHVPLSGARSRRDDNGGSQGARGLFGL